jgi:hypothetical protein
MFKTDYRSLFKLNPSKSKLEDLDKLGLSMTNNDSFFPSGNANFIWEKLNNIVETFTDDAENLTTEFDSKIPSGYVYLGQFIDHDLSFDSKSRFEPKDFPSRTLSEDEIAKIANLRKPLFDLETIYGYAKPSRSSKFVRKVLMKDGSNTLLQLGKTFKEPKGEKTTAQFEFFNDLPRAVNSSEPLIVDERNDGNLLIAQLQVAFIKFHNAIVQMLGDTNSCFVFRKARKIAIRHYQYIVLNDFLPRIVKDSVIKEVIKQVKETGHGTFFTPNPDDLFIPLEFSTAAYRMGHSMIRNDYNINTKRTEEDLIELFKFTGRGGFKSNPPKRVINRLQSIWVINWNWFFDLGNSDEQNGKLNFAKKIDTKLSSALDNLFPAPVVDPTGGRVNSLGTLDLYRGQSLRLPSGQSFAGEMSQQVNIQLLTQEEIESTFGEKLPSQLREQFKAETPLFYYLLAEAEIQNKKQNTETLGDVGSRIVAEVFIKLLYESPYSILKNELEKDEYFIGNFFEGKFGMPEMLKWMASNTKEGFDELNPVKQIV